MKRLTDNIIILVTQKTRLENLIRRYNTVGQARFFIERHGGDFEDYLAEDGAYRAAVEKAADALAAYGRLQVIDREFLPGFLFGEQDLVVAVGRDGLVANTLKYLTVQKLIGVNPDPARWDGVLLPFSAGDLSKVVPEAAEGRRQTREITLAQATLNDGQRIVGVNDLFIGQRTHASARYRLQIGEDAETQSSSGIIVSTGLPRALSQQKHRRVAGVRAGARRQTDEGRLPDARKRGHLQRRHGKRLPRIQRRRFGGDWRVRHAGPSGGLKQQRQTGERRDEAAPPFSKKPCKKRIKWYHCNIAAICVETLPVSLTDRFTALLKKPENHITERIAKDVS